MARQSIQMTPELHEYLLSVSVRETDILRRLREETALLSCAGMQIAPEEGQFLALLLRMLGARRCIEVGVFTGYSSLVTARALPEDGYLLACDKSHEYTNMARRYWAEAGVDGRIDLRVAPAVETLNAAREKEEQLESFDFAFIDADKGNYPAYYEACLSLIRPGGLIAVDNTLWSGRLLDAADTTESTATLRAFNRKLHADERIDISQLPLADGLTLCRKRD